ncbi:hypothetical protein [Bacillus sp. SJS]|uniref:hypothetical protein n=1 Tax=Bacillus sp. SJS TaxID=1423321 RepID=UPI0004DD2095|nr:hypothetical protein [Bacillus sp. SJS]KZZ85050.1 hypothetical protein AS29_008355 [Bacillus sp. SJS]
MAIQEKDKPVFDEKVQGILRSLANGKTREEIADDEGNKNWKSVDMYMRRRNFQWDGHKQTYVPKVMEKKEWQQLDASKAGQVISLLSKEGADLRSVAGRLGFKDHKELAIYMNSKGYAWVTDTNNYLKQMGKVLQPEEPKIEKDIISPLLEETSLNDGVNAVHIHQFLPILQLLEKHQERLSDLIIPGSQVGTIPRYIVPGIATTKTIHMMNTIVQLVLDFSREKNITQREIFEVALIEFFRKYGYENEIERLLT